ncbi:MAG TPA: carboxypeptidase regulatory-like domain-containing protein, partial [Candidatus Acidoferrales bacterium]|nr:carboxypeptidase regulatory-like domain-containing protein [Candidatus Acidoferrales bacterium]
MRPTDASKPLSRTFPGLPLSRRLLLALLLVPLLAWAQAPPASGQGGELYGRVQTIGSDGQPLFLVGAQVTLTSKADPNRRLETKTDESGAYRFAQVPAGDYVLSAKLESYDESKQDITVEEGVLQETTLTLKLAAVQQQVEVTGEKEGIQVEQTAPETQLKGAVYENAPVVSERFQEALPLVPGVVRGPDGLIKIKGAPSTQTGWLVNSANVTDPVTGERAINLPVDVIESVEVLPNPYSAEYGKFSGAVTQVETKPSTNKWKFGLRNFVPRFNRQEDHIHGVEAFTPRLTVSGPIVKDKVTFLQSFEYRFLRNPVTSLPENVQDTDIESFDSFSQLDFTISPSHNLTAVFSVYPEKSRFATLNTFNPQPTTANYRQKGWMAGFKDRYVAADGSLLETLFSVKDFDVRIYPATPGTLDGLPPVCDVNPPAAVTDVYVLRPECNFGSFFNQQDRVSRRTEWVQTYNFKPLQGHGQHLLKVGYALSHDSYRGTHQSHDVEVRRNDNTLSERVEFSGNPLLDRDKTEVTLFVQDKWNPLRRLTLDFGARYDYDTLAQDSHLAPRGAFALVLTQDNHTLLRGGLGLFYDKVPLNVGTFPQLQQRTVTLFAADGVTVTDGPRTFFNVLPTIRNPYSIAWNVELDREVTPSLLLRLGYLQREGRDEYIVEQFDDIAGVPTVLLEPRGRSRYREFQLVANYRFRETSFLNFSYVHSEAAGDLNVYEDYFGNYEDPLIRANERSRLRQDVPDRFLVWGEIKLLYGVWWAPVFDIHSGFIFSALDEEQNFVGARNHGGRLPVFASFDTQFWKDFRFKVKGKIRTVRLGIRIFNLLDRFNPRDVQENLDA